MTNTPIFWEAVWSFLFVELFDSFGTLVGTMQRAKLLPTVVAAPGGAGGEVSAATIGRRGMDLVNRAMMVDGLGLFIGAIIGSNSITCYIESNTGIEAGARTGFASVVTGVCFLFSLCFVAPFVGIIPDAATTCALVFVGVCSLEGVRAINWDDFVEVWVAFTTIAIMGFTYSIANGICFAFIGYAFLQSLRWSWQAACDRLGRPQWKLEAGTNCALPHPLLVVLAIFMVFRFRYLGA
jgi:AGZA family xanthine/uracil permease-like MFS transporter